MGDFRPQVSSLHFQAIQSPATLLGDHSIPRDEHREARQLHFAIHEFRIALGYPQETCCSSCPEAPDLRNILGSYIHNTCH